MSDSDSEADAVPNPTPSATFGADSVDQLRRGAKQVLRQVRAGDAVMIARLRKVLPRLESLDDEAVSANIKLADIQHAIARQRGLTSWRELTRYLQQLDPVHVHAARFLHAVREHHLDEAKKLFTARPELASYSIHTAAAVADAGEVANFVAKDPANATRPSVPDKAEPILYASDARLSRALGVSETDRFAVVQTLLDAGASANTFVALADGQQSPIPALYFACVSNNVQVAKLLLEHGANPNDGESVYHAAEMNHRECLELLLAHGADISSRHPHWDNTPLYFITGHKQFSPMCESSELGMEWLLQHGADPNIASYVKVQADGSPGAAEAPLHRVAAYGKSGDVAAMLLKHGAVVDLPRGDGRTAYVLAVRTGNSSVAEVLRAAGADTSALTSVDQLLGECALAEWNEEEDPHARNAKALLRSHPHTIAELDKEDRQALALAIEEGREASVRLMVSLGWSLTDEGAWGGTPLHHAAWHGRVGMTKLLLELGSPVDIRDSSYGSSPLAWAAHGSVNCKRGTEQDYVEIVEMLLDAGSSRAASYNSWNEPPEQLGSAAVARVLQRRRFAG